MEGDRPEQGTRPSPPETSGAPASHKRRGFKFVGPTITYAWMQAVGIVDDHQIGCFRRRASTPA